MSFTNNIKSSKKRNPNGNDSLQDHNYTFSIDRLKITNFRNHSDLSIDLKGKTIVLYGKNGAGKTNILEAISLLNPGRGLRKAKSKDLYPFSSKLNDENHFWAVNADVSTPTGNIKIGTGSNLNINSRQVKVDNCDVRQSDLSKLFKVSWITPQMLLLFNSSMREKRQFLDRLVNYFEPSHINILYKYEKLLRERTRIILEFNADELWVQSLENNISKYAYQIISNRQSMINKMNQFNKSNSEHFSKSDFPQIKITLSSKIDELFLKSNEVDFKLNLLDILSEERKKNLTIFPGPHQSSVSMINLKTKKEIATSSTGEQKIMLISVILYHAKLLDILYNSPPILLLDDILEHLDNIYKNSLFKEVLTHKSQCWFTSTNIDFFSSYPDSIFTINLDNNILTDKKKELVYA